MSPTLATRFGEPAPTAEGALTTSGGCAGQPTVSGKSWVNGHPVASVPLTVTVPENGAVGVPPIETVDPTTGVVGVIPAGSPETSNVNGAVPAVGVSP